MLLLRLSLKRQKLLRKTRRANSYAQHKSRSRLRDRLLCYATSMETQEKFSQLIEQVEEASKLAREYFDSNDFSNEQKSDGSVVTAVDQNIERVIRTFIDEHFPDDAIVGEEEENKEGTSGYVWHVDPIDGTDNFLRKIPFCAVSIARLGDTPEGTFAIVHNPITNLTFSSIAEGETRENEHLANLTAEPLGGRFTITIGRGREDWMKPAAQKIMIACANEFGKSTAYGSTALELAYLSAGRIDGFLTFGLNTYDYAAGLYLVKAAGGAISVHTEAGWQRWEGTIKELCDVHGKTIFASHPEVHEKMRDFIGNPRDWSSKTLE